MTRATTLRHEFVTAIPAELHNGVLYVSLEYATALHLCCCGCGTEVVTPLNPSDWRITYDGETVSVCPSIGNWSFPCRSHYWIDRGRILWCGDWTKGQIERARDADRRAKRAQYSECHADAADLRTPEPARPIQRIFGTIVHALRTLINTTKARTRD